LIQTKADTAVCSSIGNVEEHEKFKKLPMGIKLQTLEEVYNLHGIHSDKFYEQIKPLILWTIHRNLRGLPNTYMEDLLNNAYEELIIAFEGGYASHYNKSVYKERLYNNNIYNSKYRNIGYFIMYHVGASVSKFRNKNFRRQSKYEDDSADISEKINYTDFEINNNLTYEYEVEEERTISQPFKHFKINEPFSKHIQAVLQLKPRDNIFYNLLLWEGEKDDD
jgi:hypothetical protein